jgi:hypothetical protein
MQRSKKSKTKLLYENYLWKQGGLSHYYGLAIYIFKSILWQKKNYVNFKYFTM